MTRANGLRRVQSKPRVAPRASSVRQEISGVRADLLACTAEVQDLRRILTSLRAELDHLREKIRS
jgi:hypothetical protein